jgi:hypothetical protein
MATAMVTVMVMDMATGIVRKIKAIILKLSTKRKSGGSLAGIKI